MFGRFGCSHHSFGVLSHRPSSGPLPQPGEILSKGFKTLLFSQCHWTTTPSGVSLRGLRANLALSNQKWIWWLIDMPFLADWVIPAFSNSLRHAKDFSEPQNAASILLRFMKFLFLLVANGKICAAAGSGTPENTQTCPSRTFT
jgi:hypothetical protein